MPKLVIISFNMQGVPGSLIAEAIVKIKPDILALQEAPVSSAQFYSDLDNGLKGQQNLPTYNREGPIREYPLHPPQLKGGSLDAQGSMKQITVFYNAKTLTVTKSLALVDLINDQNTPLAKDVHEARDLGFASRTPAYCRFAHTAANVQPAPDIGLFVWHAPTKVDPAHKQALGYFGKSYALSNARSKNDLTILAGDFNDDLLPTSYRKFDEGIQHKYDWLLADKATGYDDLLPTYPSLMGRLHTTSMDHFAMAA